MSSPTKNHIKILLAEKEEAVKNLGLIEYERFKVMELKKGANREIKRQLKEFDTKESDKIISDFTARLSELSQRVTKLNRTKTNLKMELFRIDHILSDMPEYA